MSRFKTLWESLPPERKRRAVMSFVIGVVILFGVFAYSLRNEAVDPRLASKEKALSLKPMELKRQAYLESRKESERVMRSLVEFEKRINNQLTALKQEQEAKHEIDKKAQQQKQNKLPPPPTPTRSGMGEGSPKRAYFPSSPLPPPPPPAGLKNEKLEPQFFGGIEFVTVPIEMKETQDGGSDKKKEESVYLPPSFMEATLISGLDAPTVENAKGNPMPVMLRIKAPAVLPNRVRANLRGCFVIAGGYGDLAAERAYLRLVTLSCISKKGGAVIDQAVKGFVVDEDGKIGLRGRVVSKMGTTIARSMIAGFFGGVGDALRLSGSTTTVSPLGTTRVFNPERLAQAGIGSGLGQAANEIQKFYLELARQTMPVIEVGATKQVTLVVQEGAILKIKNACVGVEKGCG